MAEPADQGRAFAALRIFQGRARALEALLATDRVRAKIAPALPLSFATRPLPKIEHWSLKIWHWQFSILNLPSKLGFLDANSIPFELRLTTGSYFCAAR
jgi:hypothetical protein